LIDFENLELEQPSPIQHFHGMALVNIRSHPLVLNHPCYNDNK